MYVTLTESFETDRLQEGMEHDGNCPQARQLTRAARVGETLFAEGDEANYIYEIVTGVVRLARVTVNGRRQVIAFGFPGDVLGFPDNGRYHADCDVIEAAEIRAHPRRVLDACTSDPGLHRYLVNAAMAEISAMQDHFLMLGRKSASEKTAAFLSVLLSRIGTVTGGVGRVHLPMCRSDIADFLGLTTETVSRTISQFRADGVLELRTAQDVVVLDPAALQALSELDK